MRTSLQAALSAVNLYSEYFLGLIISLTIARNLSTDDYGLYSSIIWLAGLIILFINSGLAINATKFVAEFSKKDLESRAGVVSYFWQLQHIRVLLVLALSFACLFLGLLTPALEMWTLILLVICAVLKADYMFKVAIFKGIKRYDVLAKTSLIANPFNIAAVLICAYVEPNLSNFVLVYCCACIVYGISIRMYSRDLPASKPSDTVVNKHRKRILLQTISATGIVFLGTLMFKQSQVVVLERSGFFSEAGFFNIAFLLSTAAMTLIPGVYQEILLPKITDAVQNGDVKQQVAQAERYLMMLSLLVAIPVVLYADVIVNFLYGERYGEAAFALQVMVVLRVIMTLNQGASLTLISQDKQFSMLKLNVIMFVITVILSTLLVPKLGLNGALLVYGALICILLFSYNLLAKRSGYVMVSFISLGRIAIPAIIAALPVAFLNQYISGLLGAVIGSILFIILYLNLLFLFKGYDKSVGIILNQIKPRCPPFTHTYLSWAIETLK